VVTPLLDGFDGLPRLLERAAGTKAGGPHSIAAEALRHYRLREVYPATACVRAFTPRAGSHRRGNARLVISCVVASCRPPATRAASLLQAPGFRGDAAAFRLNASVAGQSGSESAFRLNRAERVDTIEAAHSPEVATKKALATATSTGRGFPTRVLVFRHGFGMRAESTIRRNSCRSAFSSCPSKTLQLGSNVWLARAPAPCPDRTGDRVDRDHGYLRSARRL
jgi:hypothetical protein